MSKQNYKQAIEEAKREYAELVNKAWETQIRISRLKYTILHLASLCGDEEHKRAREQFFREPRFAEACREILHKTGKPLTPIEVRGELEAIGFDLAGQANPLASIHTTLKRLVESGEAKTSKTASGKTAYEWKSPIPPSLHPPFPSSSQRKRRRTLKRIIQEKVLGR